MKQNLNKEKLLLARIAAHLKRVRCRRKKEADEKARTGKTLDLVQARLSRWVAEGKHRIKYGCMEDTLYCSARLKKSFHCWRKELRMEEAKKMLLEHPEMPAYQVGIRLGITDKSNFRYQFKSVTGMTPSQWRDKFKK